MQRAVLAGVAAALAVSGTSYGFWSTSGTGSGTGSTATVAPITITAGTPSGRIYPGGTADVATSISNPNTFPIRITSIALDPAQGTGGFSVDAGHSGCGLGVLSFLAQSNGGDGWTVPASSTLAVDLLNSLSMTTAAANTCQGATFTVYLAVSHDLFTAVKGTTGLVGYWRLGNYPAAADNFSGTAGTALTSHTGTVATSWTTAAGTVPVLTDANRLRRNASTWALSASGGTPPSADYSVQTDVVVQTLVAGDSIGVVGRLSSSTVSYYSARYQTSDNTWRVVKTVNGTDTSLASSAAALTPGSTYRLRFDLIGTSLILSVNGTTVASATDSTLTAAGRAGLQLGTNGTSAAVSNSTGFQADDFRLIPGTGTTAPDVIGGNTGTFVGGLKQNEPGAIAGDLNPGVLLGGTTSAMQVSAPSGLPVGAAARSVELWFNRTATADQTLFSYGPQSAAALFAARLTSATNLRVTNFSVNRDFTLPYGTSNGVWHHLVVTYDGTNVTGYLDGAALGQQTLTLATTLDATGFVLGATLATSSNYFSGSLDEAAVYATVLTPATVKDHYRVGSGA